ncbi:maleylpyruvate isomerase family mycothiol-dependent enzyme [Yinghuangia sp. ASG 101]|uniref:maleylpyruvate isomerase family mycothiol-dependent enzyme n=1 Tax=Yinghuangia sp. ASG 101 TaxID=2896848 RepID=UPI001E5640B9|nr:maleylpyruvate isomerase family mycothiol-dependent enzyme [Yinghuangia sp. ASG 101]UGQ14020.1 maleylpyruvate isomerase family mycothiol-dependent enzyme [Yinghuangia sp. ASG 101]
MAEPSYGWEHGAYCAMFVAETDRLAAVARGGDLTAPVPTCPGWTVAKLLKHVGTAHAWAAAMVRAGASDTPVAARSLDLGLPDEPSGLPDWLTAGARESAAYLREAGPDAPAWTFGPVPHARFWGRRMLHETLTHRLDAELALGITPRIAPEVAADTIDEFLTILPHTLARAAEPPAYGSGETLHIHTSGGDRAGEWTITLEPDGYTWERGHAKGDAALRGDAAAVMPVLLRRADLAAATGAGDVEVLGDAAVVARWLELSAL